MALGASPSRLLRQLLAESLLLALLGGAGGLLVAIAGVDLLIKLLPADNHVYRLAGEVVQIDSAALVFTSVISILTGLIFGLAPVINTVVSMFWHPRGSDWFRFDYHPPHPLLWVGIILVGLGAALVLYSKELTEAGAARPHTSPGEVKQNPAPSPSEGHKS